MNAKRQDDPRQISQHSTDTSMKSALVKSSLFHVLIFIVALFGIPFAAKEPIIMAPVTVELVDISDVTQTNKKPPPKAPPIEKPKEPEAPKPPPEELKKPEPPKPEPKEPDPVPPPKPKEEPKKEPEKPKDPPKPKPPEPKEEPKPQEDLFNSLLKDLTPKEEEKPTENNTQDVSEETEDSPLADIANQLSISEIDAIRAQLEPCWNVPAGAKFAEDLVVQIQVRMNRDRTVNDIRVVDRGRYSRDNVFRAAADSAMRALRNPRCTPLNLPPEKYDQWKTITINFDPSDML